MSSEVLAYVCEASRVFSLSVGTEMQVLNRLLSKYEVQEFPILVTERFTFGKCIRYSESHSGLCWEVL